MTAQELRNHFLVSFDISNKWPTTFEVDAETYANVCQEIFNNKKSYEKEYYSDGWFARIAFGNNNGIMFKNIELIYKSK